MARKSARARTPPAPGAEVLRQSQLMIAAVMAALRDSCDCRACRLLRRLSDSLINALLEVEERGGE